ncbi:MAG TPA: maleylpyruvate isomerase family mycothiol-dependent enzyme [Kineosporiaceae bacterium]|nr:maleylpyruvate isomerase family mycothiol-dependent enzyme [Kineosporiaceae bacterium]
MTNRGLASAGRDVVEGLVVSSWDAFLTVAQSADLDRPTRLPGWRAQEICVHLGVWDDYHALDGLLASARAGGGPTPDVDAANARVTTAHRNAPRTDVLAALHRHRDAVQEYLRAAPGDLDLAPTAAPVGVLPLLTTIAAECYELAVHALDLADAGAAQPPESLLQAGLAALADVTGALAAAHDVPGGAALLTPTGGWRFEAGGGGWVVEQVAGRARVEGPAVTGEAGPLLDASAGRANPVALLARRRLGLHDAAGLLALAPLVEVAPNLPGGPLLRVAARSLSGAAGLLTRLRR